MTSIDERVTVLEVGQARLEERVDKLESWQTKQNGTLQRLEEKIDIFMWWIIGVLGGVIVQLALTILKR